MVSHVTRLLENLRLGKCERIGLQRCGGGPGVGEQFLQRQKNLPLARPGLDQALHPVEILVDQRLRDAGLRCHGLHGYAGRTIAQQHGLESAEQRGLGANPARLTRKFDGFSHSQAAIK